MHTASDRIRYVLNHVNVAQGSWTARELFFLVKKFFPAETRSSVRAAAMMLCSCGELAIHGRRYRRKAQQPVTTEAPAVVPAQELAEGL